MCWEATGGVGGWIRPRQVGRGRHTDLHTPLPTTLTFTSTPDLSPLLSFTALFLFSLFWCPRTSSTFVVSAPLRFTAFRLAFIDWSCSFSETRERLFIMFESCPCFKKRRKDTVRYRVDGSSFSKKSKQCTRQRKEQQSLDIYCISCNVYLK